ncbi:hypothetical protein LguiB_020065 [Lonicera macranthoides]
MLEEVKKILEVVIRSLLNTLYDNRRISEIKCSDRFTYFCVTYEIDNIDIDEYHIVLSKERFFSKYHSKGKPLLHRSHQLLSLPPPTGAPVATAELRQPLS